MRLNARVSAVLNQISRNPHRLILPENEVAQILNVCFSYSHTVSLSSHSPSIVAQEVNLEDIENLSDVLFDLIHCPSHTVRVNALHILFRLSLLRISMLLVSLLSSLTPNFDCSPRAELYKQLSETQIVSSQQKIDLFRAFLEKVMYEIKKPVIHGVLDSDTLEQMEKTFRWFFEGLGSSCRSLVSHAANFLTTHDAQK